LESKKVIAWPGLINLFTVYVVWGSTYLAIRVAVRDGGGFTPFMLGSLRVIAGGLILLIWGALAGQRLKPTRQEWKTLLVSGLMLWVGGNGLVNWAEQRIDSGLAALIIAATPIWVALVEAIVDRRLPSGRMFAALVVGFLGIVVLTYPTLGTGVKADFWSVIGLLGAGLSWGTGSVYQSRKPVQLSPRVNAGYQHLVGAVGFIILVFILREPIPTPSQDAWLAFAYLVVFGSLLAFTAYVTALQQLPTKIVVTYAYVNPVIAVFLGWFVLQEPVSGYTLAGAALVLLGVSGVFRERYQSQPKTSGV
jgi:drug/metabolite transporter (DMT)-like permease